MKMQRMRGNPHPDVITTSIAIDRTIIKKANMEYVDIETNDGLTRGAVVIDYLDAGHIITNKPNVELVYDIDYGKFVELLVNTLKSD